MNGRDRTLLQATRNAERIRAELPHLIQPSNTDFDIVRLLDELHRMRRAHVGYYGLTRDAVEGDI